MTVIECGRTPAITHRRPTPLGRGLHMTNDTKTEPKSASRRWRDITEAPALALHLAPDWPTIASWVLAQAFELITVPIEAQRPDRWHAEWPSVTHSGDDREWSFEFRGCDGLRIIAEVHAPIASQVATLMSVAIQPPREPVNASRAITEFIVKIESESQPPSYEEHLAGRLLDKGADVNLRAHMLDLAAKWDALAGDARDKRSTTMRGCARDIRDLAGRPS